MAIRIRDTDDNHLLAFDLIDLLRIAGPAVATHRWICRDVEAFGPSAEALHAASDLGTVLSGDELIRIASGISQVIDGDFRTIAEPGAPTWLRIRAIDSTEYVVATADEAVLAQIRAAFHDVRDLPDEDV